ncbi:MAG: hypothetical protein IJ833_01575, partial [Lachnospiraceae bacterium]|nr:hypothetical protein [Lachnospiraceae bacterium]
LYDEKRKRGYQIVITDDTRHQQYLQMINNFNANLKEEVAKKTAYIKELTENNRVMFGETKA